MTSKPLQADDIAVLVIRSRSRATRRSQVVSRANKLQITTLDPLAGKHVS
jgi:hypothetical protein